MERNTNTAAGQGLTLSSGGAIAGTADLAGGDLTLKSGIATGTGSSAMRFFTATAQGSTNTTDNTPTEKMTILGNGNVGIGITVPNTKLSVSGTISTPAGLLDPTVNLGSGASLSLNGDSLGSGNSYAIGTGSARNSKYDIWFQTGATNGGGYRWYIGANEKMTMDSSGKIGIGTTSPATKLEIGSSDLGSGVAGPIITLGRNTNTTPGAGSINFINKDGTAGYVWQDAAGKLRINTSAPTNAGDALGNVIGEQTSTRDTKQDTNDYSDYNNALSMIVNAPLHTFRYIKEVEGYGADSPLAKTRLGFISDEVDPMFMVGNSIDQVSINGLLMASIKELNLKLEDLAVPADENNTKSFAERFYDKLIAWLGSSDNGLNQICVKKSDGTEFCANGDQLEQAVNAVTTQPSAPENPLPSGEGQGVGEVNTTHPDLPQGKEENLPPAKEEAGGGEIPLTSGEGQGVGEPATTEQPALSLPVDSSSSSTTEQATTGESTSL